MKYLYCFAIWVAPYTTFSASMIPLLNAVNLSRTCVEMTEQEFAVFRADIFRDGLELKEIERTPVMEPEGVL